ncbi:hypothetical protein ACLOJK_004386, partial [Asimina triloba]
MRVHDKEIMFNILSAMKYPSDKGECHKVDIVDQIINEVAMQIDESSQSISDDSMDFDEESLKEKGPLEHIARFEEIEYEEW